MTFLLESNYESSKECIGFPVFAFCTPSSIHLFQVDFVLWAGRPHEWKTVENVFCDIILVVSANIYIPLTGQALWHSAYQEE